MQFSIIKTLAIACILFLQMGPQADASETGEGAGSLMSDYLAARIDAFGNRFDRAAERLTAIHDAVPASPHILRNLLHFRIGSGDFEGSLDVARQLDALQPGTDDIAVNLLAIGDFVDGDFNSALQRYQDSELNIGSTFLTILSGWTHFVNNDAAADAVLEGHDPTDPLLTFVRFHHALIHALRGNYAKADETVLSILEIENPEKFIPNTLLGEMMVFRVQLLAAQGRVEDAKSLAGLAPTGVPELAIERLAVLKQRLSPGETIEFDYLDDPVDGIALFASEIGSSFAREGDFDTGLIWAHFSSFLNPDSTALALLVANRFEELEGWEMAEGVYGSVPPDDPLFKFAEIARAETLHQLDRTEEALNALKELITSPLVDADVHLALGRIHNVESNHEQALESFNTAIDLIEVENLEAIRPKNPTSDWLAYYYRAIALERLGQWQESKVDFRRAAQDSGQNPYVLNYLGYSLADKGEELDEAMRLIRIAVEKMPENGAFIDSLGWVLYKLGRYDEAVPQLELAIRLEPHDPVVMDHLGDAYWTVGRKREAEFQWRRALEYDDEITDEFSIMRKLEVGLGEVIASERLQPVVPD